MKKIIITAIAALLCAVIFTGCGSSIKEGTYRAEFQDFDDHGWKDYVELHISDGKITGVDYDSVNIDGAIKSQDEEYKETMNNISGTYPEKYMKELENMLLDKQDPKMVDSIAGATDSVTAFRKLATEAISKGAKKGSQDIIQVVR